MNLRNINFTEKFQVLKRTLSQPKSAVLRDITVAALFAVVGVIVTQSSSASSFFVAEEAENGVIAGLASAGDTNGASGGSSVKFGVVASAASWPSEPPARMCGSNTLNGPVTAPAGAITVPAGNNANVDFGQAGKTYWFAPGTHTLGTSQFDQIGPGDNTTFIGAPGAIVDGQKKNDTAFGGTATGVKIQYLTITGFSSSLDQGVVNHDSGNNWVIQYNYMHHNNGAAVFAGSGNTISYNCLSNNGQYGFQVYNSDDNGPHNVVLDHNEIASNNLDNVEASNPGCGCSGGGKFWNARGVTVTNNYVHDNQGAGLWADTNDANFLIEGNWIENNDDEAIFYEISYNAMIRNNVFKHNATKVDPTNNYDKAGVFISESGGDSRVDYSLVGSPVIEISNNLFQDNFQGVWIWENADRFCGSPNNSSSGYCTLGSSRWGAVFDETKTAPCNASNIANEPYYSDCRWKSQNVKVHNNNFTSTTTAVNQTAIYSNFGTSPSWSPYTGNKIINAITKTQGNVFSNNTYTGNWQFINGTKDQVITKAQWQTAGQDAGSTFH